MASFLAWVSQNLARTVEGSWAGPLFRVTVHGGAVPAAGQIFEP